MMTNQRTMLIVTRFIIIIISSFASFPSFVESIEEPETSLDCTSGVVHVYVENFNLFPYVLYTIPGSNTKLLDITSDGDVQFPYTLLDSTKKFSVKYIHKEGTQFILYPTQNDVDCSVPGGRISSVSVDFPGMISKPISGVSRPPMTLTPSTMEFDKENTITIILGTSVTKAIITLCEMKDSDKDDWIQIHDCSVPILPPIITGIRFDKTSALLTAKMQTVGVFGATHMTIQCHIDSCSGDCKTYDEKYPTNECK